MLLLLGWQAQILFTAMLLCFMTYLFNFTLIVAAKGYKNPALKLFLELTVAEILSISTQIIFPFLIEFNNPMSDRNECRDWYCYIQSITVNSCQLWAVTISIHMALGMKNLMKGKQFFVYSAKIDQWLWIIFPIASFLIIWLLCQYLTYPYFQKYGFEWGDKKFYYLSNIQSNFLLNGVLNHKNELTLFIILISLDVLGSIFSLSMLFWIRKIIDRFQKLGIKPDPLFQINQFSAIIVLTFNFNIFYKLIISWVPITIHGSTPLIWKILFYLTQLLYYLEGSLMTSLFCYSYSELFVNDLPRGLKRIALFLQTYNLFTIWPCCRKSPKPKNLYDSGESLLFNFQDETVSVSYNVNSRS